MIATYINCRHCQHNTLFSSEIIKCDYSLLVCMLSSSTEPQPQCCKYVQHRQEEIVVTFNFSSFLQLSQNIFDSWIYLLFFLVMGSGSSDSLEMGANYKLERIDPWIIFLLF